eukprot:60470-Amphidinium_carterae.1
MADPSLIEDGSLELGARGMYKCLVHFLGASDPYYQYWSAQHLTSPINVAFVPSRLCPKLQNGISVKTFQPLVIGPGPPRKWPIAT